MGIAQLINYFYEAFENETQSAAQKGRTFLLPNAFDKLIGSINNFTLWEIIQDGRRILTYFVKGSIK